MATMVGFGFRDGLLLLALCLLGACQGCSLCDSSKAACDGNEIVECDCEGLGCETSVRQNCDDHGMVCREYRRSVACVLPDERCPAPYEHKDEFCDGNTLKICFGDDLRFAGPCEPGWSCVQSDTSARCEDDTPPCSTGTVLCESDQTFRFCVWGRWGPQNICRFGTACDPTQLSDPCVPTPDAGALGVADAGEG